MGKQEGNTGRPQNMSPTGCDRNICKRNIKRCWEFSAFFLTYFFFLQCNAILKKKKKKLKKMYSGHFTREQMSGIKVESPFNVVFIYQI